MLVENLSVPTRTKLDVEIGIRDEDRQAIAEGLSQLLADTYTLYLMTHNFHWNVTGPSFEGLHARFETQYLELAEAIDRIAERIRALGLYAPGSYSEFSRLTSIPPVSGVPVTEEMIRLLVDAQETVVRTARSLLPRLEDCKDQPTLDLVSERIGVHEKNAWMLRSLIVF
ncbi:Dps family protein [Synechococcus sp. PCC 7336]|uniref:Dps family protein n=1 Tax=Synechococcus sp. PCC 7336 TaxID=195250 RepID=UPI000346DE37|nr:Dps family protein [Synechococcus sp. PCC 7336]